MTQNAVRFLLVEPDPVYAESVRKAFSDIKLSNPLLLVRCASELSSVPPRRESGDSAPTADVLLVGAGLSGSARRELGQVLRSTHLAPLGVVRVIGGKANRGIRLRLDGDSESADVAVQEIASLLDSLGLAVTTWTTREGGTPQTISNGATGPLALIIDDDPWVRSVMTELLCSDGFSVVEASDGVSGLERPKHHQPDIILLDLALPGRSGLQVLQTLKDDQPTREIPVIVASAYALVVLGDAPANVAGIVQKPVDLADLLARVRHATDGSRRQVVPQTSAVVPMLATCA